MRSTIGVVVLFTAALAGGCAARVASAPPAAAAPRAASGPAAANVPQAPAPKVYDSYGHELVDVAPGVQVLANSDEPIFYAREFYWRFEDGRWYRSFNFATGWVEVPPTAELMKIRQPHAYTHHPSPGQHSRGRSVRRPDPPKSMYQTPPRRLSPLRLPEGYPNSRRDR